MSKEKPAIFINYRRALSQRDARLLYLMLDSRFPGEVFIDEETLVGGDRWRPKIERCIKNCSIFITLIPAGWVGHLDRLGIQSKLYFDKKCHVRNEIEAALENGNTIIPVLVNGAVQPLQEQLPASIQALFETFNIGMPLDFIDNPNVANFEKFFNQIAQKAKLQQQVEAKAENLFHSSLDKEFPLPADLAESLPDTLVPFIGLKPFKRADARIFFGRSREIYNLCFKITKEQKSRLFLLDGYSGTGKSSLLQAGLIPRVQGQGWAVAYRRREESPLQGLKGAFNLLLEDAAQSPEKHKLLILDQVEEAITDHIAGLSDELEEMAQALKEALGQYPNYKFVLGFRSDYMAKIAPELVKKRLSFDNENTLQPLDLIGATEAICGAAYDRTLHYNLSFTPETLPGDIAKRLLKGVENYHIAPFIQVSMALLWQRCLQPDGSVTITSKESENIIDRQEGLLDHYLKKIRESISEGQADDQKILQLLDEYVAVEPTSASRFDAEIFTKELFKNDPIFEGLHKELKSHYLLTEIKTNGQLSTRLSHDVLAKVIRERYKTLTETKLELTETKLESTAGGYFDELKEKLSGQIYGLEYFEAQSTLNTMFQLNIRREELIPFLFEMLFFWNETKGIQPLEQTFAFWRDSNLLSQNLATEFQLLLQKNDRDSIRQWLQKFDPNKYDDLLKKYCAPKHSVMLEIAGGQLEIGEDKGKRLAKVPTFHLANVQTTWWQYGLFLFATSKEKELKDKTPNWGIKGDHPVVKVSWYDAIEYCNWLSSVQGLENAYSIDKTKKDPANENKNDKVKWLVTMNPKANGYRLPTELEWEFAARGGTATKKTKYAGSDDLEKVAWYDKNANGTTHAGGELKPNELGLYDMSGNVWEWCFDWKDDYPQNLPIDFSGAESGSGRVLRGGAWYDGDYICRVAFRYRYAPNLRNYSVGFRLAQD